MAHLGQVGVTMAPGHHHHRVHLIKATKATHLRAAMALVPHSMTHMAGGEAGDLKRIVISTSSPQGPTPLVAGGMVGALKEALK